MPGRGRARVGDAERRVAGRETTVAVVEAVYWRATPGVNAPNDAGAPSVSESVAGTVPPTPPWPTAASGPCGSGVDSSDHALSTYQRPSTEEIWIAESPARKIRVPKAWPAGSPVSASDSTRPSSGSPVTGTPASRSTVGAMSGLPAGTG